MTNISYDSLIFSEFRTAAIAAPKNELTEANIIKAMTVNEELVALGYTLSPASIISLSKSPSVDGFYEQIKSLIGDVKAAPMYPSFPNEVLEMSEAQFRFQQIFHYMSTYGMEAVTGAPVLKGWLPEPAAKIKIKDDDILLNAKVIDLISEDDKYSFFIGKILRKAERMTDKEKMIVKEAITHVPVESLSEYCIKFKQNMLDVFYTIFSSEMDSADKLSALHAICQHTGDVWKCMDYTLTREKFHLRTSQKKLAVKLLESYPVADFEGNAVLSGKKGSRVNLLLNYFSYNTFSRSPAHAKVVDALRDGELRSWESRATKLIDEHSPDTVSYIASRPGVLLRKLAFLIRKGYSCEELSKALIESSEKLSMQTLISVLSYFGREDKAWEDTEKLDEAHKVYTICEAAMRKKLSALNSKIKGKKVFLDFKGYDLERSSIQCNSKSAEGGYLRSGLAIKLPENINRLRFFVYWNDARRVDVDLHASGMAPDGSHINIGWSSGFRTEDGCIAFSGDITHSDAAEYIDVFMDPTKVREISTNINLYYGAKNFKDIDECYVGMMAVNSIGEEVKLYNPANCFFSHYLTGETSTINYGIIDVEHRVLVFGGSEIGAVYSNNGLVQTKFNLKTYLEMLLAEQGAVLVEKPEDAENIIIMEKPSKTEEISLLDENFFIPDTE